MFVLLLESYLVIVKLVLDAFISAHVVVHVEDLWEAHDFIDFDTLECREI